MKPLKFEITKDLIELVKEETDSICFFSDFKKDKEIEYKGDVYYISLNFHYSSDGYIESSTGQPVQTELSFWINEVSLWDYYGNPLESVFDEEKIKDSLRY